MKKILIVDDDPDIRELLSLVVEMSGYSVITAENGQLALDILETETPDIIALDMMMPVMSGLKFLEIYSQNPRLSTIPVVVNSAYPARDFEDKVFAFGVKHYFRKGHYTMEEFMNKLESILLDSNS